MESVELGSISSQQNVTGNPPPFCLNEDQKSLFCDYSKKVSGDFEPTIEKVAGLPLPVATQPTNLQKRSCLQKIKDAISYIWKVFLAIVTCGKKPFPVRGKVDSEVNKKAATAAAVEEKPRCYTITEEFRWRGNRIYGIHLQSMFEYIIGSTADPFQLEGLVNQCKDKFSNQKMLAKTISSDVIFTRFVVEKEFKNERLLKLVVRVLWDSKEKENAENAEIFNRSNTRNEPIGMEGASKVGGYFPTGVQNENAFLSKSLETLGITEVDHAKIPEIIEILRKDRLPLLDEDFRRHISTNGLLRGQICSDQGREYLTITVLPTGCLDNTALKASDEAAENPKICDPISLQGGTKRLHIERVRRDDEQIARTLREESVIGFKLFIEDAK